MRRQEWRLRVESSQNVYERESERERALDKERRRDCMCVKQHSG